MRILYVLLLLTFLPFQGLMKNAEAAENSRNITLYYTSSCPYCRQVLSYLETNHKALPSIDIQANSSGRAALEKAGGDMRVPCLVVNGQLIYGSDAIIDWLSDHPEQLRDAS